MGVGPRDLMIDGKIKVSSKWKAHIYDYSLRVHLGELFKKVRF